MTSPWRRRPPRQVGRPHQPRSEVPRMSCRRLRWFRGVWRGRCVPPGATAAFSTRRVTAFGSMFRFRGAAATVTRTLYAGGGTACQPDAVADGVEHHEHDHRPMQHGDGVEPSPADTRQAVTARHLGPASQFITRPAGAGRDLERGANHAWRLRGGALRPPVRRPIDPPVRVTRRRRLRGTVFVGAAEPWVSSTPVTKPYYSDQASSAGQ
jgi:hypothetical protein